MDAVEELKAAAWKEYRDSRWPFAADKWKDLKESFDQGFAVAMLAAAEAMKGK